MKGNAKPYNHHFLITFQLHLRFIPSDKREVLSWLLLTNQDSNLNYNSQSVVCYRYTISQKTSAPLTTFLAMRSKNHKYEKNYCNLQIILQSAKLFLEILLNFLSRNLCHLAFLPVQCGPFVLRLIYLLLL